MSGIFRAASGRHRLRAYKSWYGAIYRCTRKDWKQFKDYGGRGIKVCERWMDFENFYADMGEPAAGLSLDRIDNNGDYSPQNCRWATKKAQQNNMRNNVFVTAFGRTQPLRAWADELGLKYATITTRLRRGWPSALALRSPEQIARRLQK
jgi:hypothetical protein